MLFGILVVCLGSILYLFVTRTIVPLHKITYATDAIAKGNLSVTVPAGTNNDIGELGSAVNELAANFQEIVSAYRDCDWKLVCGDRGNRKSIE